MFNFEIWISLGQDQVFLKRTEILLLQHAFHSVHEFMPYRLHEYVNSINCHTYLFELLLILHYIISYSIILDVNIYMSLSHCDIQIVL